MPAAPSAVASLGEVHRVRRVVGARAGDDRDGDRLDDRREQAEPLVVGEHRRLAGGAGDDEAVVAVVLQVAGQAAGLVEVERTVVVERGDHRGEDTTEPGHQKLPSAARSMPWVRMRSSCSSIHTSW
jgi:hypothetical protein